MKVESADDSRQPVEIAQPEEKNDAPWGIQQLDALMERLGPRGDLKPKIGALMQYAGWVGEIKKNKFQHLDERLPPQAYELYNRGRSIIVVHKRTLLQAEGRDENLARQELETFINKHITEWKDHEGEIPLLDRQIDVIITTL